MAGIMPTAMEEEAPAEVAAPEGDTVPDDESNVTPEEQKAYEEFVLKGYELLYEDGKVREGIVKLLDDDPADLKKALGEHLQLDAPADPQSPEAGTMWDQIRPVIVLGAAGAILTLEVLRSYDDPKSVDGAVILHGGKQFVEDLAEIAGKTGAHDYSEAEMADAFRRGADIFRDAAESEGLIDTEQAKGEWGQIVEADKQGDVDAVVPGISALAPKEEAEVPQGG
jgi:hypothetical protein